MSIYNKDAVLIETAVKMIEEGYDPNTDKIDKNHPIDLTPDNIRLVYKKLYYKITLGD